MKKPFVALALASVAALSLAGCSTTPAAGEGAGDTVTVAASTNVYGSLAAQIGGDRVDVTSIITSATQDPHSYEASARDRLTVQKADLVIENGGGYDGFIDTLLQDAQDVHVVSAVEFSHDFPGNEGHSDEEGATEEDHDHDHDHAEGEEGHEGHNHIEGFNEHVWFDPHTMIHVVEAIADELATIDPDGEAEFTANAEEIVADLEGFEADLETLKTDAAGANVIITEPLPGYIATAAGLTDVTPEGFAEAVEEGSDVAPATLLDTLNVVDGGDVAAVLTNAQTGGAETQRVEDAATAAGIPVVAFTELLPEGSSYSEWMSDAIQSLADALQS
ncbi:zinc/manganese transport system substrate-binding protein [Microbacterium foliorum]|uniref:Zinc/manganese transport system substrate-binding protein n=1 Tax=Microbacterium foliorum TaxID=104336 RepID=A0ABU1HT84_9MICO|nr:zinc ABC transporter substrate-binding protein [Microbacterium foliorum]MDR6143255.1 zinc/manganese transport system substrate-binding protein [Microbacterium foliorum]